MSGYTRNALNSINYNEVCKKRRNNFRKLHNTLKEINKLSINYSHTTVPLCYPLYNDYGNLIRNELIKDKIFVPKYWPNLEKVYKDFEKTEQFAENIVALPIDQRYNLEDMAHILQILKQYIN
jgi:dTDP-4-amino-4,6-dideoxygalactose transaminase